MIEHLNPGTLHRNPAFSQGTIVPAGRLLFVGEQNGVDGSGELVGPGLGEQTVQALRNVLAVLEEAGASPEDVAKLTIYLDAAVDPNAAYAASMEVWGPRATAVTVLKVAGLGRPGALVGVEAVAALG
ncbi:RidA family protein [Protaetiibacter mangrovi]|uniref:RidA family protein n=1 Tax=Protaetiibacter mangrovi TaxID=2970926 RepID=A0ABT1ZD38_9MICO|nr:RidA family protein [Protaetiibacter mangrovi]MCS0498611.1 RidA family protein [Protaetiibacter mangrovi]